MNGTTRNTSEKKSKEILYSHLWVLQVLNVSWQIPGCENKIGPPMVSTAFRACPEVVKINELSFVLKSLEKKNFGACRGSDRFLLECSSDYWLNHVGATIAQAPT